MRPVLAIALLALAVSAGCTEPSGPVTEPTYTEETTDAVETTTETTTTETDTPTTSDEPQKGDQLLSVSELNESQAKQWNESQRAAFENLSTERQQVVEQAIECDCNVELDGEFDFDDKERVEVVQYDGRYYFLRVAIV